MNEQWEQKCQDLQWDQWDGQSNFYHSFYKDVVTDSKLVIYSGVWKICEQNGISSEVLKIWGRKWVENKN